MIEGMILGLGRAAGEALFGLAIGVAIFALIFGIAWWSNR